MTLVVSQVATAYLDKPVDREKICPFLLRVFCANGRHNSVADYYHGSTPANELQIYTWQDCSLRELVSLIKDVNPDARRKYTNFEFAVVAPDKMSSRYIFRSIGSIMNGQRGMDDSKTLSMCKVEIGDFIDVAITIPNIMRVNRSFGAPMDDRRDVFGGGHRERRTFSPIRDRERNDRHWM